MVGPDQPSLLRYLRLLRSQPPQLPRLRLAPPAPPASWYEVQASTRRRRVRPPGSTCPLVCRGLSAEDGFYGRALRAYCQHMAAHFAEVRRVVRSGGVVAYAVANSTRRGRPFDLVGGTIQLMLEAGFVNSEIRARSLGDTRILPWPATGHRPLRVSGVGGRKRMRYLRPKSLNPTQSGARCITGALRRASCDVPQLPLLLTWHPIVRRRPAVVGPPPVSSRCDLRGQVECLTAQWRPATPRG